MTGTTSPAAAWQHFLHRSLVSRLEPEKFEQYVQILEPNHGLEGEVIADIFLSPRGLESGKADSNTAEDASIVAVAPDPRIPRYVQILLGVGYVSLPNILRALLRYSAAVTSSDTAGTLNGGGEPDGKHVHGTTRPPTRWANSFAIDEALFYRLAKSITSGTAPKDLQEAGELILVLIRWMEVALAAYHAAQAMLELGAGHMEDINSQIAALGTLAIAAVENPHVVDVISKGRVPQGKGKELSKVLANFVPTLLSSNAQIAARLELFRTQTLFALEPVDKGEVSANKEIEEILDDAAMEALGIENIVVVDLPVVNCRAGLYVYLNALLVGRPLVDDAAIFAYLHNRYQGDNESTITDLILASFDILADATSRNERPSTTTLFRSFLINKIPLLLSTLSTTLFPPLTSEYCITGALNRVDTNAFPTLSNMFDESTSNNMFSDSVRQDFCFACCLHGLIEESSIETLLGDVPMQSLPAGGRYQKQDLVQQCMSDPQRAEGLIEELEGMDGNVGAASQAITEVIIRLCAGKETMTLKTLCSLLSRKSSSLDIILLFNNVTTLLQPLCDLLDSWQYDEDQGEYQPVYEEFGSILLLVLSFTHRYGLSNTDLGIRAADSFVARLLNQYGSRAMVDEDLTDQQKSHLDGWIHGLFDNESGGLGDELMSSCPPQDFYLLIPTLFHHILLALATKNLSEEGLKGGLEYLVDTFLLPSLIPGITWLSTHLWESRGDADSVLLILSTLMTTPTSSDASQMLLSILNIIAKSLEHSLRWLQHTEPQRQNIDPLSRPLRPLLNWERHAASEHTELEAWTANGFANALRGTIQGLVAWAGNHEDGNPSNYTHRQFLVGVKMLGARRVLSIVIDEVKAGSETHNASIILDVATALICAPDPSSSPSSRPLDLMNDHALPPQPRRLTLRDSLKLEASGMGKIHKTDPFHAENVIRLFRKVEAQSVLPIPVDPSTSLDHAMGALGDGDLAGALEAAGVGETGLGDMSAGGIRGGSMDLGDLGGGSMRGSMDLGGGLDLGGGRDDDFGGGLGGFGFGGEGLGDGMGGF
ncbi:mediator complex, subunit Med5 [Amylocarpus encephaloides]|uniref:Mediator of RNA polymerase II transcription subunit 5 n=1 Tax=Amylocarpus encephaloides TaxID=45428 RepID=A0A9P8C3H7_9HELO|nr:mediator complex, subunit Med5 [Amylocarpus encephaloides]